jgi:hypothetical protein
MWVTFWNTSSTCLIVALNVNSYKSILKSITDRAANLTIKHLWTFAMDQGEYSGNVYAQCCCVPIDDWTRAISEQWTLAHYSSRERLINESHKLSPLAPLCTMVKLMVRQCCLIDAHTFGSLCRCCVAADSARLMGPIDILLFWSRPVRIQPRRISYLSPATAIMYLHTGSFVYISRIYLYPSKKVIDINTRPPCVSICSLPFALA